MFFVALLCAVISTIAFAGIYMGIESWSFGNAMWFAVVTITTIGYGDLTPVTQVGQGVWILVALFSVSFNTLYIGLISASVIGNLAAAREHSKKSLAKRKEMNDMAASQLDNNSLVNVIQGRLEESPEFRTRLRQLLEAPHEDEE